MSKQKHHTPGFTLLELLISVTIMLLMVGGGIASYFTFQQRREVVTAGQELRDFIRLAQQKAAIGEVPRQGDGCDQSAAAQRVVGYRLYKANASRTVSIYALCGSSFPGAQQTGAVKYSYSIPSSITISPTDVWSLSFSTLQETPVISPASITASGITLSGSGKTFTINITAAGSISGS